ncbi:MAG: M20/M25/M40 family metallo-hydrolase [Deltaproteobacteria bacterium]|nr:M20/M25/M40 family metallo-hydrolase [Deltaproteobacteria bacterium]
MLVETLKHTAGDAPYSTFGTVLQIAKLIGARRATRLFLVVLLFSSVAQGQERYRVPWDKVANETIEHFQALLRIDTTNPPGNETLVAEHLKKILEREGIPAKLLALEPRRANLVARIRGNGSKRPILVMGHTDVVGVQRERWTVDPFGAVRKNGYIYGRGSADDKDNVVAGLMLMLLLKRHNVKLDRDVIFLAEAGEESFAAAGLKYVIERHWNEIDAEFAVAEGGGGSLRDGKAHYVRVGTTEKVGRGARLIARGTAGHGSIPRPDNAVVRLANAVAKLAAWTPPMRLNETTRTYFERLATISHPDAAARYKGIFDAGKRPEIERHFAQHELRHNSMIRTSINPTMLKAGFRSNVVPSEAEAYLDIRALPDEEMENFIERMREVIGDPNVEIKPASWREAARPSRLDTEMFRALEEAQKRVYPEAITLPYMLTGATDMTPLRARGVQAYGIGPLSEEGEYRDSGGAHGDDERILERALHDFVRLQWYAVLDVAASR